MKTIAALFAFIVVALAYDDIRDQNFATVIKDKSLQNGFFSCLVDVAPCDDFGSQVKGHVQEFMKDACRECDKTQKRSGHLLIQALKNDFPDLYKLFEAKYDPDMKLLTQLDEAIKSA